MDLQELQSHKKRTPKKNPPAKHHNNKTPPSSWYFFHQYGNSSCLANGCDAAGLSSFFFVASRCLRRFERRSRGWHLPYKKVIDARTIAVEMRCTICRIFQSPSSRLYRALEFVLHLAESQQPAVGWRTASNTGFHKQICQSYPQASSPGNGRRSTCWTDKQCQVHLHATLRCASEHHASGQSSVREGQTARRALDGWCGCFRFFFFLLACFRNGVIFPGELRRRVVHRPGDKKTQAFFRRASRTRARTVPVR